MIFVLNVDKKTVTEIKMIFMLNIDKKNCVFTCNINNCKSIFTEYNYTTELK